MASKFSSLLTSLILLWLGITCLQVGSRTHYPIANSAETRSLSNTNQAIFVDLSDRQLCYLSRCYPIGIGAPETPTPTGTFQVMRNISADPELHLMPVLAFKDGGYNYERRLPIVYSIHTMSTGLKDGSQGCIITEPQVKRCSSEWLQMELR
ncbi:MAG: L,D-transpeptidase [Oculatellaceae cyanobacterium bins.114]|nr:L,D-transpeptidase [Oculatellaceae cyanobacterium bins.114]